MGQPAADFNLPQAVNLFHTPTLYVLPTHSGACQAPQQSARWYIDGDTLSIIDTWYGAEEGRYEFSGNTLRIYTDDAVTILRRAD